MIQRRINQLNSNFSIMDTSIPQFAFIQNVSNAKYLESHASQMQPNYETPNTLWRIMLNSSNNYYIQNQANAEFLTSSASKLSPSAGYDQQFNLIPVSGTNYYYIQNVSNKEYLTSSATKMSKTPGTDEQFYIAVPPLPFTN